MTAATLNADFFISPSVFHLNTGLRVFNDRRRFSGLTAENGAETAAFPLSGARR
jgi:hypothetical protein